MDPVRPAFVPDPALDRAAMEAMQFDIAEAAVFADDLAVDPALICGQRSDRESGEDAHHGGSGERCHGSPVVAGVDQAFRGDMAVSAIVASVDGEVIERASAAVETAIPYIPGLLAFREGNSILAAFRDLDVEPDLVLFDGSGRIHYRQAGIATHVGVTLDVPAVGVIKNLLCGEPRRSLDEQFPEGTRIPIDPDDEVEGPPGGPIGYALQTRQFEGSDRYVNPVYVSPGHRVSAETATDVVEQCTAGYKLPEPIRLADRYADDLTAER
jgi:deoxyribonuclease V